MRQATAGISVRIATAVSTTARCSTASALSLITAPGCVQPPDGGGFSMQIYCQPQSLPLREQTLAERETTLQHKPERYNLVPEPTSRRPARSTPRLINPSGPPGCQGGAEPGRGRRQDPRRRGDVGRSSRIHFCQSGRKYFLRFTFQFHFFVVESHKTEIKHSKEVATLSLFLRFGPKSN